MYMYIRTYIYIYHIHINIYTPITRFSSFVVVKVRDSLYTCVCACALMRQL